MKQDRKERKEIRDILLGRTLLTDDGRLTAPDPGMLIVPQGVVNGAGPVRFLGVKGTRRYYSSQRGQEELMAAAERAMMNIGRAVYLREQPDTVACLLRYLMTRPAVLTFRFEDDIPVLTVWMGRGLMGWITRFRAFSAFERELSEEILPAAAPAPKKKKKKRRDKAEEESAAPGESGNGTAPEEPAEEPMEEPAEEYVEEPMEEYMEEPAEEYTEEYMEEPAEEYMEESMEEPIEEPTEEQTDEPILINQEETEE